ncbi:RTA1 like protein-domain-containing protein [Amylocarpus encephaloides]|uniref:RTA1 like protein-domain-containing protein n=1 Tax=Amylocarpus encephaloides TaxID=45428 RepID=A0A9P8C8T5_9HELO|nr:RTA1 like protein-domain-containing protein [Amylocarpus encephaloides]
MWYQCLPRNYPGNQFFYCPSMGASILFSILFGFTTIGHIWQAAHYKKPFMWVLIMGAIWQTLAFIIRCISIMNPLDVAINNVTYCLVLLAPLWTNAFCYMVVARLVHMYMPNHRLLRIKGSWLAVLFVLLDVVAFIIQLLGALDAINTNEKVAQRGIDIYTGGISTQEAFILGFTFLTVVFLRKLKGGETTKLDNGRAVKLTNLIFVVLGLISFRIIYRIIEFSAGFGSKITREIAQHEAWQYCFDTLPMFLALVAFHVYHPGKVLQGQDSQFPTRKEKKAIKAEKKEEKKQRKAEAALAGA